MTKHNVWVFGVNPLSSDKTTLKQQLNGEKRDVGCFSAYACGVLVSGVWEIPRHYRSGLISCLFPPNSVTSVLYDHAVCCMTSVLYDQCVVTSVWWPECCDQCCDQCDVTMCSDQRAVTRVFWPACWPVCCDQRTSELWPAYRDQRTVTRELCPECCDQCIATSVLRTVWCD